MSIGEKIKQARVGKNMSQEELAAIVGVSRQAISKWESDKAIPTGANREILNQCLEIKVIDEDESIEIFDKKKKILFILGWGLATVFAFSTMIFASKFYKMKNSSSISYLPTETISAESTNAEVVPGTDSNSESVYIYYDNDMASEVDVVSHEYAPEVYEVSDEKVEKYKHYLAENVKNTFESMTEIKSAHTLVGYDKNTDQYAIKVFLESEGNISNEQIEQYKEYLEKTFYSVELVLDDVSVVK